MPAIADLADSFPLINGIPVYPIFGSEVRGGINTAGDALAVRTADGVPLQKIWDDIQDANSLYNDQRSAVVSHLAFSTTDVAEAVPQSTAGFRFELASEFGQPKSNRLPDSILVGYDFHDWDLAVKFTWQALRAMTARQVEATVNSAMEADNRLIAGKILERLMTPAPRTTPEGNTSYGAFSNDGTQPLDYLGKSFADTHTHYLVSGASVVDSGDLEDGIRMVTEHGYGRTAGSQLLLFCNQLDLDKISSFRAGEESRSGGPIAAYSWIPSPDAPAYLTQDSVVGKVAPADFNGLKIQGQYGPVWCTSTELVPAGYLLIVASGGPNSTLNPVGFRQHVDSAYRGLLHIPGPRPAYPLQDSFFVRSFGTGVRHRGAAAVVQIKASGSYDVPAIVS